MNFNSVVFLIYLPLVILIHWLLPHKVRWVFLLAASYLFYAYNNFWLLFLIIGTTLISYFSSLIIEKTKRRGVKILFLILSLVLILGSLFIFKYLDFTITSIVSLINLFGGSASYTILDLILPVGISFFTFQTLSYVIDVYRGKVIAERHLGYYALFVSFFPQLVAGPIERPGDLLPQLKKERFLDSECFAYGFQYLLSGFLKKIVIADFLGVFVTSVYGNATTSSGASLMIATFFFALQIYGDFSGYSDIAIGSAHLLGIKLTKNFDHPYLATSVRDFYRRWHITLNTWLTDYVYIPLGGSRCSLGRRIFNTMVVFLISGFWHGASWNYVLWGVINGILVCIELLLHKPFEKFKSRSEKRVKVMNILAVPFTFIVICCTWVFFRASDIQTVGIIYQRIFTSFTSGTGLESFNDVTYVTRVILTIALFLILPYIPKLDFNKDEKGEYQIKKVLPTITLYISLIMVITFCWIDQLATNGESGFIYFQF